MPEGAIPRSVGIIGLGVMGGSLARAIRLAAPGTRILAWSPDSGDLEAALEAGVLDLAWTDAHSIPGAVDLLVYAAPLEAVLELVALHGQGWGAGLVVTDVTSLQGPVLQAAARAGGAPRFVASHPLAGSHRTGFGASRPDLYRGARVWVSGAEADPDARAAVESFWKALGSDPAPVDPEEHDRAMTRVSHLPQLLATLLANRMEEQGVQPDDMGPGARDMTRLAASAPSVWMGILREAGPELPALLQRFARDAQDLAREMEEGDWRAVESRIRRGRAWKGDT